MGLSFEDTHTAMNELTRRNFLFFLLRAFPYISGGEQLKANWHLSAMAYALDQVRLGRSLRLLVNLPPRNLKSITISVAWVAWMLGNDPTQNFVCVSYSNELSGKLARDCLAIMQSNWYREVFPGTNSGRELSRCCPPVCAGRGGLMIGGFFPGSSTLCKAAGAGAIVRRSMAPRRRSTTASCGGPSAGSGRTSSARWPERKAFPTVCSSTAPASRRTAPQEAQKGGLGQWYRPDTRWPKLQAPRHLRRARPPLRADDNPRKCPRYEGRQGLHRGHAAVRRTGRRQRL